MDGVQTGISFRSFLSLVKEAFDFDNARHHKEEPISSPNTKPSVTPNDAEKCSHIG